MNAYVFPSLAAAQACAPFVDAAQGYPKVGVDVPGGVHVVPTFVTVTYARPLKHPTLAQWAYPADGVATPALTPQAVPLALPLPAPLDPTWFPVPVAA